MNPTNPTLNMNSKLTFKVIERTAAYEVRADGIQIGTVEAWFDSEQQMTSSGGLNYSVGTIERKYWKTTTMGEKACSSRFMRTRKDAAERLLYAAVRAAAAQPASEPAPAQAPAKTYPVRLFWVYDPAIVTDAQDHAQLILAASPSCAISKACEHDAALEARHQHLHSSIAYFSR